MMIYGLLLIFSVITTKFVLIGYGSETNGLLSSINQVFGYIALLEAGIGTATITALYSPISKRDDETTIGVLQASKVYYRRASRWYFLCVVAVAFVWPFLIETTIPKVSIFGVILFQGISGVITFCYTSTIVNYLTASGKHYLNNNVHALTTVGTYCIKLCICFMQLDIVYMSLTMVGVNILKCLVYRWIMKKYCPSFFEVGAADLSVLKQRNSFLIHEISGVIFSSTDTIILSVFCGLKEASVYAVYSMVLMALRSIIGQVFNGTNYILGNAYSNQREDYEKVHDQYNLWYIICVFIIYSVAYVLLLPFVSVYTNGVNDANYLDYRLPLLFVMIELLSACRVVDNQLIKNALHARQTISRTVVEACINLVCSLVLVQFMGIYGVLLGTIIALLYRVNDLIIYANTKILHRRPGKEYGLYAVNFLLFAGVVLLKDHIPTKASGYGQLILIAILVAIIVALVYLAGNLILLKRFFKGRIRHPAATGREAENS